MIIGAEPHLPRSGVLSKMAAEWRGFSDAERKKYATMAAKEKERERISAVAAEVSDAVSGGAGGGGGSGADRGSAGGSSGPVIPLFVRATRQVLEGAEYWLSLTPSGEGRLSVDWRIPAAATCVILALGWAQGRPSYVERTDSAALRELEGTVHFTEAHIARFAGSGTAAATGAEEEGSPEAGAVSTQAICRSLCCMGLF